MTNLTLTTHINTTFITDRFGKANTAVYLNSGYMAAPSGTYFSGDWSATAWVYLIGGDCRLFDFVVPSGDSAGIVTLTIIANASKSSQYFTNGLMVDFSMYACGSGAIQQLMTNITSTTNTWIFVASSLTNTSFNVYINGILAANMNTTCSTANVVRTSNLIGRDSFGPFSASEIFYLDDLMFYNKGLTQSQIQTVMSLETTVYNV